MVHFILLILKIIGIIFASILGILLLLILVVLFVPIRYKIYGEKREDIKLEGRVTWILHLIQLRVTYESNKSIIKLKVFGKLFYDSQNLKDNETKKDKKKKSKGKKVKSKGKSKKSAKRNEKDLKDKNLKDKKDKKNKKIKENKDLQNTSEAEEDRLSEEVADNVIGKVNIENIRDVVDKVKDTVTEVVKEELIEEPIEKAMDETKEKASHKKESGKSIEESIDETKEKDEDSSDADEYSETNKGPFYKFKTLLRKLIKIPKKIIEFFIKVKNSIKKVYYIIIGFLEKWHKIKAFLHNDINKKGLKNIILSLKKVFRHIRPKKLNIDVEFGTGDPCSTGQLLGGLAMIYGYYGETVQIIPNFETEILEGSIFCKGRIRLFTLLIICIKLILNKEFRMLIENFKVFKEELL